MTFYVIGAKPSFNAVQKYFFQNWQFSSKPEVILHDKGYFVIKFGSLADYNEVADTGPHMYFGKATVIKPWTPKFNFNDEMLRTVPLWVRFPDLPLHCWSKDSLSRLGSAIGSPLYADECTSKQLRVSFARLLVEVDVTKTLTKEIPIEFEEGDIVEQKVIYEWVPPFCVTCNKVGHNCAFKPKPKPNKQNRKKRQKKMWVPKAPGPAPVPPQPQPPQPNANMGQTVQVDSGCATDSETVLTAQPAPTTPATPSEEGQWKLVTHKSRSRKSQPSPIQVDFGVWSSDKQLGALATLSGSDGDGLILLNPP